ncbi:hypothetical protein N7490_009297 [Penicillium lividum]|nr:hypothetical protein N7490_009297 [Penicillium lividum]
MSPLESLPPEIWCKIVDNIFTFDRNEICGTDGDVITPLNNIGGLNFASMTTQYRVRGYISRKFGDRKLNILRSVARDPTTPSRLAFAVVIGCVLTNKPLKRWTLVLPTEYAIELANILADAFIGWELECTQWVGKESANHQTRVFNSLIAGAERIIAAKCRTVAYYVPKTWYSSISWKELEAELKAWELYWMIDMLSRSGKGPRLFLRMSNVKREGRL